MSIIQCWTSRTQFDRRSHPQALRVSKESVAGTVCLVVTILLGACHNGDAPEANTQQVTLSGKSFVLELALDQDSRYRGLSDRSNIPFEGGMLFVFPKPKPVEFVMRRCLVPIDLIFLSPSGRIIAMHAMTIEPIDTSENELHRYPSYYNTLFAIELKGGTLKHLSLALGMKILLPIDSLKQRAR